MIRFPDWIRKVYPWWLRHYNRLEIRGIENLPRHGSAIIVANHSGGNDVDNFAIMSALEQIHTKNPARKRIWHCYWDLWSKPNPIATKGLAPAEIQMATLFSKWVQKFSPIPISLTGDGIPYKLTDLIVKRGELISIYPEGHSAAVYEGYRLWKFYPGVIKLHLRYKIPIIPAANIGFVLAAPILANQFNPKKVPPWEKELMFPFLLPIKLIIHFGKPISFSEFFDYKVDKEDLNQLAQKVRLKVREQIHLYQKGACWNDPYGIKQKLMYLRSTEKD